MLVGFIITSVIYARLFYLIFTGRAATAKEESDTLKGILGVIILNLFLVIITYGDFFVFMKLEENNDESKYGYILSFMFPLLLIILWGGVNLVCNKISRSLLRVKIYDFEKHLSYVITLFFVIFTGIAIALKNKEFNNIESAGFKLSSMTFGVLISTYIPIDLFFSSEKTFCERLKAKVDNIKINFKNVDKKDHPVTRTVAISFSFNFFFSYLVCNYYSLNDYIEIWVAQFAKGVGFAILALFIVIIVFIFIASGRKKSADKKEAEITENQHPEKEAEITENQPPEKETEITEKEADKNNLPKNQPKAPEKNSKEKNSPKKKSQNRKKQKSKARGK